MTTPIYHSENWPRKKKKKELKVKCTRLVVNISDSKKAGGGLIPSLSPSGFQAPAIHKVTVHPTGKHSLQPAITSDCASLCNLETLFTQPKNTSIQWESRVNWANAGCLPIPHKGFHHNLTWLLGRFFSPFWHFIFEGPTTLQAQPQVYPVSVSSSGCNAMPP